ncbi:unnamed protein product, partial [Symbiodinium sp. CCMP2456]
SKSFYCKRLCDDGLKTKGNREPACIQGCLQKFSQVVSVLELYEEKCPDCKVRGDDDRRDDDKKRDDDKRRDDDKKR